MSKRSRPDWDKYFLGIAKAVAQRSTCISRINGAIVVKNNKIVGTGYNGWASGMRNCLDHFHLPDRPCPRIEKGHRTGEGYGILCKAVHAEANALMQCKDDVHDATLYLYSESLRKNGEHFIHGFCLGCLSLMMNKGISRGVIMSSANGTEKTFKYNIHDLRRMYMERSR